MYATRRSGWAIYALLLVAVTCMRVSAQNGGCGTRSIQLEPMTPYIIESPGYPSYVTTSLRCDWIVTSAQDTKIKLVIRNLQINPYSDSFTVANSRTPPNASSDYHYREGKVRAVLSSSHVIGLQLIISPHCWDDSELPCGGSRFKIELFQVVGEVSLRTECSGLSRLFLCQDQNTCLVDRGRCDAVIDCPDQSDERNCTNSCPANEYCTNTSACLKPTYHCDGIPDCNAAEDEKHCDVRHCPKDCTCLDRDGALNVICSNNPDVINMLASFPRITKILVLKNNNITDLEPRQFLNLPHIEQLSLEDNQLTRLKSGVFTSLHHLWLLNLTKNNLITIDPRVFEPLKSLKALRLDENNLSYLPQGIFQGLSSLTLLNLKKNNLKAVDPGVFEPLVSLMSLNLEGNQLTRLTRGVFTGLLHLGLLKLNKNNLYTVDPGVFESLESLQILRLDDNNITNLTEDMFLGLSNLTNVRLGSNSIGRLNANTFRHLSSLIGLDLVENQITTIEPDAFSGLVHLRSLELRENLLTVLRTDMFSHLKSLAILTIEDNPWTVIERGAFNGLENLQVLALVRHRIVKDVPDFTVDKNELEHMENLLHLVVNDQRMCCLLSYKPDGIRDSCILDRGLKTQQDIEISLSYFTCDRLMHNSILRVFIWCLGISALIGNTFIIAWRLKMTDSGKRSQSVLILNLAASDLIMGVYMLIIAGADAHFQDSFFLSVEEWRSGHLCNFAGFLSMLSSEASVFFITMISIDRFLCVVFPFGKKWLRLDSARVASLAMWGIALLISIPPLLLRDKIEGFYGLSDVCVGLPLIKSNRTSKKDDMPLLGVESFNTTVTESATPSRVFSVTVYLGINLVCCLIVLLCYLAIAFVVIVKLPSKKLQRRKDKEHRKKEMAMARRMLLIVGTDFCCWMPVIIMGILSMSGAVDIPDETYAWVVVFVIPINASINPYLYTFSNTNSISLNCCKFRGPGSSVNSVKMKPLQSTDAKDLNQRCRSGTHTFL